MPSSYQITIHDRAYSKWSFTEDGTTVDHPRIHPLSKKLFSKDIFMYDPTEEDFLSVVYSPVRDGTSIPGILILENNKTYGRTSSKKRLLYKCIPNDSQLPAFLIPYEVQLGFSKTCVNKYVLFKFHEWTDTHPQGILLETIGDVNHLDLYYEYQLHCKHVHSSITHFTNKTREQIKIMDDDIHTKIMNDTRFHIENRLFDKDIFTIDPAGSTDLDDAFSFTTDTNTGTSVLSIYIANVYVWLEQLGLWEYFSDRVSTIYLPDKKRTMLPTILSENLCSLKAGEHRFAFVMDIHIDNTGEMTHTFKSAMIKVKQNYVYESDPLLANTHYKSLFHFTQNINPDIKNSHDLVAHWMVRFNTECAKYMSKMGIGIQRFIEKTSTSTLSNSFLHFLTDTHLTGKYILFGKTSDSVSLYTHATSPIRRLVDLLNQICIMISTDLVDSISPECMNFMRNWMSRIQRINDNMRNIRKVQNTCDLLYKCITVPGILDIEHTGILFDKKIKNTHNIVHQGIECFTYSVYLEDLKLISKFQSYKEYTIGEKYPFKLYIFNNEYKQKIRVQMGSDV